MKSRFWIALAVMMAFSIAGESHAAGLARKLSGRSKKGKPPIQTNVNLISADLEFGIPAQVGTGCDGAVNATRSFDGSSLSVLFDDFSVEAGQTTGVIRGTKNCTLRIPVRVPAGMQLVVTSADFRGFNSLPQLGRATIATSYRLYDSSGTASFTAPKTKTFFGPIDEEFTISHSGERLISACGGDVTLEITTSVNVVSNASYDPAMAVIDSVDMMSNPGVSMKIKKLACN